MAQNNNMKPRKNWFGQKRDQFGNDWLNRIPVNDILNSRLRIIQDISKGNFDYNGQDMIDFCDQRIINGIIEYSDRKVAEFVEITNGLAMLQSTAGASGNTSIVLQNCKCVLDIYRNIKDSLEAFRMDQDITRFINMMQNIKNFRNYIDLNRAL